MNDVVKSILSISFIAMVCGLIAALSFNSVKPDPVFCIGNYNAHVTPSFTLDSTPPQAGMGASQ